MKPVSITFAVISLFASNAFAENLTANFPQSDNQWYLEAEAAIKTRLTQQPITTTAKNVILMIADGNGVATNYGIRLWMGQQAGGFGDEFVQPQETMPNLALVKTYNVNAQTPDSAGTGTAIHTGVKTKIGVIGVDETLLRGQCDDVEAAKVSSIAEILADQGKLVGVISTARITHATPATAYAHVADRSYEDGANMPKNCTVPDIALQLLSQMKSGGVDLAMGGGRRSFLPKNTTGNEGHNGRRQDGRNLITEAQSFGAQYAWNYETFTALDLGSTPILGLFESSHMLYQQDRIDEPSLAEMTKAAITALQDNEDGFFLTIEAGRVDHANHAGVFHRTITEGAGFSDAVAMAIKMTNAMDTLIIVTADHGHSITFNGYCGRGTPINGLCYKIDNAGVKFKNEIALAKDGKPYTVVGYLNGENSVLLNLDWFGNRPDIDQKTATGPVYQQQALVPLDRETHSGVDVAVYSRGPWAHLLSGTIEQNFIFNVMKHATSAK